MLPLFGYEKKFKKNTIEFKANVNDFIAEMHEKHNYGTMKYLNVILRLLDKVNCPKNANPKKQAAIDKRISELIGDMSNLCRAGKDAEFAQCAEMLKEAVYDSRKHGSELYTDEQIQIKRKQATLVGEIDDNLNKQAELEALMRELMLKGKDLAEGSAEFVRIETQYNKYDKQVKNLKEIVLLSVKAYNANLAAISLDGQMDALERIDGSMVTSPEVFAKRVEELNIKKATFIEKTELIDDNEKNIYSASDSRNRSETQSSFKNAINAEKDNELNKAFRNFEVEEKEESRSSFKQAIRNDN